MHSTDSVGTPQPNQTHTHGIQRFKPEGSGGNSGGPSSSSSGGSNKAPATTTAAQKKLAAASKGVKSISSFFGKKK